MLEFSSTSLIIKDCSFWETYLKFTTNIIKLKNITQSISILFTNIWVYKNLNWKEETVNLIKMITVWAKTNIVALILMEPELPLEVKLPMNNSDNLVFTNHSDLANILNLWLNSLMKKLDLRHMKPVTKKFWKNFLKKTKFSMLTIVLPQAS